LCAPVPVPAAKEVGFSTIRAAIKEHLHLRYTLTAMLLAE
jgi:hypothetical protein